MRALGKRFARFMSSDPAYAPFGLAWLRGLTPARMGIVLALCLSFHLQAVLRNLFANPHHDPLGAMLLWILSETWWLFTGVLPTLVLVTIADARHARSRSSVRVAALAIALLAGSSFYAWYDYDPDDTDTLAEVGTLRYVVASFAFVASWGGLLTCALFFIERERRMRAAEHQAELERIQIDGQMAEARLQMLEAQIEPHFLFNSLATVQSLYRQDPARGRLLIRDLSQYLRGALPHMRESGSTLRKEFALCEAYLRVLQVRMGGRLQVQIDLPRELSDECIPPMILPTLIENAVKHGIAPLPQGGTVRLQARHDARQLYVCVSDDGAGFRQSSGAGIGLANTRARLATLFADRASLSVVANAAGGVSATLRLPPSTRAAAA